MPFSAISVKDKLRSLPVFVDNQLQLANRQSSTPYVFGVQLGGNQINQYRLRPQSLTNLYVVDSNMNNSSPQLSADTSLNSLWQFTSFNNDSTVLGLRNVATGRWVAVGLHDAVGLYMFNIENMTANDWYDTVQDANGGGGLMERLGESIAAQVQEEERQNSGYGLLRTVPLFFGFVVSNVVTTNPNTSNMVPTTLSNRPPAYMAQIGNNTNFKKYLDYSWNNYQCALAPAGTPYDYGNNPLITRLNEDPQHNLYPMLSTCAMQGTLVPNPGWTAYEVLNNPSSVPTTNPQVAAYQAKVQAATVCSPCPPEATFDGAGRCHTFDPNLQAMLSMTGGHNPGSPQEFFTAKQNRPWPNMCAAGQQRVDFSRVNTDARPCDPCPRGFVFDNRNGFQRGQPGLSFCVASNNDATRLIQDMKNSGETDSADGATANAILSSPYLGSYPSIQPIQPAQGGC